MEGRGLCIDVIGEERWIDGDGCDFRDDLVLRGMRDGWKYI